MFGHIIHLAVAAEFQPAQKSGAGLRDVGSGNADRGEAEFLSPVLDFSDQRSFVDFLCLACCGVGYVGVIRLHSPNHSSSEVQASLALDLPDEPSTTALAGLLAPLLAPGMVVWLDGDLGAGKTTLVRALLRNLGYAGPVKSPTYTLVEVYVISSIYWYHFDFYRFNDPEEFADAGLGEYFRDDAVCLVEWPGKAAGHVPQADLALAFRFPESQHCLGRVLELSANSERGKSCLTTLANRIRRDAA